MEQGRKHVGAYVPPDVSRAELYGVRGGGPVLGYPRILAGAALLVMALTVGVVAAVAVRTLGERSQSAAQLLMVWHPVSGP